MAADDNTKDPIAGDLLSWHQPTFNSLAERSFPELAMSLQKQSASVYQQGHGDLAKWQTALSTLPSLPIDSVELSSIVATLGDDIDTAELTTALAPLMPWRKGPFQLNNLLLDTEWRSDWKWQRISAHIDLEYKHVLDIGCGNGYYGWRMLGAGAASVLGIDPMLLFVMQFRAIHQLLKLPSPAVDVLPLGIDDIPNNTAAWDTVFSMGVLYHRRSPIDHLLQLKGCLKPGGQLVLETLVIEGGLGEVLVPTGDGPNADSSRYAKMRNVWFLPSVATLESWLRRVGFTQIKTVDESDTSLDEQRSTEFMQYHSLADFLDPDDRNKTVEGYPAPRRAVILAVKK